MGSDQCRLVLGPATLARIAKETGLPANKISAALRQLIKQREVTKRSKRTYEIGR